MKNIKIKEAHAGERLDTFLSEKLTITRSQIQKMVGNGLVTVNGKEPSKHHFLKTGDMVTVVSKKAGPHEKKKANGETENFQGRKIAPPKVLFDGDEYLIVEKPAGMLVHATTRGETNTLVDWLLKHYPMLKKVGSDDPRRPAIVHRLDKEVSGLMVIPKTLKSFDYFKAKFQARDIHKEYLALVIGRMENVQGTIDFPIERSTEGKFIARPRGSELGKRAVTNYQVEENFHNYALVRVFPITGRTNQIRVHLAAINHPIVGDKLYEPRKIKGAHKLKLARVFLHAEKINFVDPNGQEVTFVSPLKQELIDLMNTAKKII